MESCFEKTIGKLLLLTERNATVFPFKGTWVLLSLEIPDLNGNYKILRIG